MRRMRDARAGQAIANALRPMADGGSSASSFLVHKLDESFDNVTVTASIDVDFDVSH